MKTQLQQSESLSDGHLILCLRRSPHTPLALFTVKVSLRLKPTPYGSLAVFPMWKALTGLRCSPRAPTPGPNDSAIGRHLPVWMTNCHLLQIPKASLPATAAWFQQWRALTCPAHCQPALQVHWLLSCYSYPRDGALLSPCGKPHWPLRPEIGNTIKPGA